MPYLTKFPSSIVHQIKFYSHPNDIFLKKHAKSGNLLRLDNIISLNQSE
jgi:hypothetical protein